MSDTASEHLRGPLPPDDRARLGQVLGSAFTLPSSGRFVSLLEAIDQADGAVRSGNTQEPSASTSNVRG